MSGLLSNSLFLSTAAAAGGLQIERSLRFNSSDSGYLSRAVGTAGNRTTWTWAGWLKRSGTSRDVLLAQWSGLGFAFEIDSSSRIDAYEYTSGYDWHLISTPVYRDPSAWYHIVFAYDTTQATASNRIKLYINGTQATTFSTETYPSPSYAGYVNTASAHEIGGAFGVYLDGYLANIHFIDGQALTPSSFTETDATTGQLIPKTYTGSYGTNGFNLLFADNSAATASTLGKDTSGLSNNWTPNNFSVGTPLYSTQITGTVEDNATGNTGSAYNYRLFDGDSSVGTSVRAFPNGTVTWTPSAAYTSTTDIAFYTYYPSGNTALGTLFYVNGLLVIPTAKTQGGWTTLPIPGSGTVTSIGFGTLASDYVYVSQIRVNSVVITEVTSGNDSLVDSPTNYGTDTGVGGSVRGNYCTLNPLITTAGTYTQGNLRYTGATSWTGGPTHGTIAVSTGKWYWEVTLATNPYSQNIGDDYSAFGFGLTPREPSGTSPGTTATALLLMDNGWYNNFTATKTNASGTFIAGSVLSIAVDLDLNTFTFRHNNTSLVTGTIGGTAGRELTPRLYSYGATYGVLDCNFGQRAFAYTAPSGFKALCTTNLPAPLVAKSNTVFDVVTYTGTGAALTPTSSLGFNPDWIWIKSRSAATDHALYDVVRGAQARVESNNNGAEVTSDDGVTAFNSAGFTLGTLAQVNTNAATYAAWCWDAGTSTVSNTTGSIASQVRANVSAGFSVVTYTGTGVLGTVGHGLGAVPNLIIVKRRDFLGSFYTYHSSVGNTGALGLDLTNATIVSSNFWNNTSPTSSVLTINNASTELNANGGTYVLYVFSAVVGYSSFGSYTGNGSTDGPFIYTGFRPKWVMIKGSSFASNWNILDAARDPYNLQSNRLRPNLSNAEESTSSGTYAICWDALSNGFKLRGGSGTNDVNQTSETLIYAAFAEMPFNYSRAR
jgi:hypothetical protein